MVLIEIFIDSTEYATRSPPTCIFIQYIKHSINKK